jgi:hypothetical protein
MLLDKSPWWEPGNGGPACRPCACRPPEFDPAHALDLLAYTQAPAEAPWWRGPRVVAVRSGDGRVSALDAMPADAA